MADFYVYLLSSLPMLNFQDKPPFPFEKLLEKCFGFVPDKDIKALKSLPEEFLALQENQVIKKAAGFETLLRNELAHLRAVRKKISAEKYLRPAKDAPGLEIYHVAAAALRSQSPLEAERLLDEARWYFLDELNCGHYFDFDALLIYALKLLILERWDKINKASGKALLEKITIAN